MTLTLSLWPSLITPIGSKPLFLNSATQKTPIWTSRSSNSANLLQRYDPMSFGWRPFWKGSGKRGCRTRKIWTLKFLVNMAHKDTKSVKKSILAQNSYGSLFLNTPSCTIYQELSWWGQGIFHQCLQYWFMILWFFASGLHLIHRFTEQTLIIL